MKLLQCIRRLSTAEVVSSSAVFFGCHTTLPRCVTSQKTAAESTAEGVVFFVLFCLLASM